MASWKDVQDAVRIQQTGKEPLEVRGFSRGEKGETTMPAKTASRTVRRAGTKSKVMEPRKGPKGPYPKTRYARTWKKNGKRQRVSANPRF